MLIISRLNWNMKNVRIKIYDYCSGCCLAQIPKEICDEAEGRSIAMYKEER